MDGGAPEIANIARNFAVLVRITGPDPRAQNTLGHAFYHADSGKTALSVSGFLLPDSLSHKFHINSIFGNGWEKWKTSSLVVTTASLIEPFLFSGKPHQHMESQQRPQLTPDVHIDVLIEAKRKGQHKHDEEYEDPTWLPAELLMLVDTPTASNVLASLLKGPSDIARDGSWDVGWFLASSKTFGPLNLTQDENADMHNLTEKWNVKGINDEPSSLASSSTRLAFLRLSGIDTKDQPSVNIARDHKRGETLLAMGSPFGILSPLHFLNSVSVGVVANCNLSKTSRGTILMADMRCLPGMEGGPVFGRDACLVGILMKPLRRRQAGGAEIQLVLQWDAIVDALHGQLQKNSVDFVLESSRGDVSCKQWQETMTNYSVTRSPSASLTTNPSLSQPHTAASSVVLVTVGDGAWASGIVLNSKGLILTNAHLLEPWRFREVRKVSSMVKHEPWIFPISGQESSAHVAVDHALPPKVDGLDVDPTAFMRDRVSHGYGRIRVRLDQLNPEVWCEARPLYICRNALDIALLQIDSVPSCICPVTADMACPLLGSKAFVIGHGLFGPGSSLCSSVSSGVVARVVKTQMHLGNPKNMTQVPAMLETTAAVYPGGSGGGVFNSKGHLIGLVTSNARHSRGSIIPHLNFSIPCAALEPVFKFASDMQDVSVLQHLERSMDLARIWSSMPSAKTRPSLPEDILDKKDGEKGSRFAKFIKEKNAEVSVQHGSDEKQPFTRNSGRFGHSRM